MPVRSLDSSVQRWPDGDAVLAAARSWAESLVQNVRGVRAVAVIGSYARGDAGFGSDLDLLVIVEDETVYRPAEDAWAVERLPVPADRIVIALDPWRQHATEKTRLYRTVADEAVWLVGAVPT